MTMMLPTSQRVGSWSAGNTVRTTMNAAKVSSTTPQKMVPKIGRLRLVVTSAPMAVDPEKGVASGGIGVVGAVDAVGVVDADVIGSSLVGFGFGNASDTVSS